MNRGGQEGEKGGIELDWGGGVGGGGIWKSGGRLGCACAGAEER